jgi:hypothetical protein
MMGGDLTINEEDLIPENPFEDVEPDDKDYEGYMGNVRRFLGTILCIDIQTSFPVCGFGGSL